MRQPERSTGSDRTAVPATPRHSPHTPTSDVGNLRARIDRARQAAADADTDALLIAPGSDLRYLIGLAGGSFERLSVLVVPAGESAPTLVLPKVEAPRYAGLLTDELGLDVVTWVDGESPHGIVADKLGKPGRVAVSDAMVALHVLALRDSLGSAEQTLAGPIMRELRMRKDAAEIDALRQAGTAVDRVHARMGEWLRAGRTEAEVGADIAAAVVAEGHTQARFVSVGSGPNGANPHHGVSERVIQPGDVVVVDTGGPVSEGYHSDSTRTYAVGEPSGTDVAGTYAVLQEAQYAAVQAVRPGALSGEIDAAARQPIADAGFAEHFIHRTGHGVGLDVHEQPYIMTGSDLPVEPGMTFTIEPGIYQVGNWGARIEDVVLVTENDVEPLNNRPHELVILQP